MQINFSADKLKVNVHPLSFKIRHALNGGEQSVVLENVTIKLL